MHKETVSGSVSLRKIKTGVSLLKAIDNAEMIIDKSLRKKIKQLMERGLSHKLLLTMNEGQINQLHKMMVSEITMVPKTDTATIDKLKNEKKPFEVYEQGVEVDKSDSKLGQTTQEPHQVQAPDGMDDEGDDGIDKEEDISEAKKKSKYNPYAICTSSVGRDNKKKFERCVMDVKRNIKEGKNPYLPIVESSLLKMVEKHISPKISKIDLLNTLSEQGIISRPFKNSMIGFVGHNELDKPVEKMYVSKKEAMEQSTKTAPAPTRVKPGTKEKEKPGKMDPNPKHQPKPKAEKIDEQGTKTAPAPTRVKPGTKEKPNTSDPFKNPKHQPKPKASTEAPKMGTVKIPDYLEFDQLKIDFKNQ